MSLARNTAYNLIGSAIPLTASLVTVPIYLKVIGLERYGLLAICWVVLGYMEVFEFGLGTATAQRVALLKDSEGENRSNIVWGSLVLSLTLGATGGLLLAALGPAVLHAAMEQRSTFTREVADSVVWLALLVPLTTCHSALAGALQGRERFLRLNLIRGIGSAALAVAPLAAAILLGPGLRVLVVALVVVRASTVAALLAACRSAVPLSPAKLPSPSNLKSLLSFGGWVTGEGLLAPLLLSAEKLAIGWFRTATAVSLYMIPFNLLSRLLLLPQSLAGALIPRFAGTDEEQAEETTREALRNLELLTTPLAILALLALKPFLLVWIGPTLADDCAPIGILLIVGFWFNSFSHVPYAQLIGTGRPDLVVKVTLLQFLPYLALLYVVVPTAGVIGAALAWSVRNFLELVLFVAATRELHLLNRIILVPAIPVVAAAVVAFLAPPPDVLGTASLLLIATAAVVRMLKVLQTERSKALRAVRARDIR